MSDSDNKDSKQADSDSGKSQGGSSGGSSGGFWSNINPGYLIAGLSTMVMTWLSIPRDYHKALRENNVNADVLELRAQGFRRVFDAAADKLAKEKGVTPEVIKAGFEKTTEEAMRTGDLKLLNKEFRRITHQRDLEVGIRTPMDMLTKVLKAHNQTDAALKFVTVTSFALGAIYSFAHARSQVEKLNHKLSQQQANIEQEQKTLAR